MVSKKDKIIYWTSTCVVAGIMLWSAYFFAFNAEMKGAFVHLGLPNYFRIELTVAKVLGALVLLLPWLPTRLKDFAYFGFGITLISAVIAHFSSGDGLRSIDPLIFLTILAVSYLYFHKARNARQTA